MYVRLLEEAAQELRGVKVEETIDVRIDLPVDAYLPASYIDREPLRLAAYRRIAETTTGADVDDVASELADRFGKLPAPARTLLAVAHLRAELRAHGIRDVSIASHELHGRVAKLRPARLDATQRARLREQHPRAIVSEATETLLLPVGEDEGHARGLDLVDWLRDALRSLLTTRDTVPAE
jgi:transcription-repair coupling factor (superfamily II helicase)